MGITQTRTLQMKASLMRATHLRTTHMTTTHLGTTQMGTTQMRVCSRGFPSGNAHMSSGPDIVISGPERMFGC